MVVPLAKATTQSKGMLDAPNSKIIIKTGRRVLAYSLRYQSLLLECYSGVLMPCCRPAHDG
jgi:hypothetical protein